MAEKRKSFSLHFIQSGDVRAAMVSHEKGCLLNPLLALLQSNGGE
jgi:hypothetical protein